MLFLELSEDMFGEVIVDIPVARDRLACACVGVLIPVVPAAMPDENTSAFLNLADQVDSLHAI